MIPVFCKFLEKKLVCGSSSLLQFGPLLADLLLGFCIMMSSIICSIGSTREGMAFFVELLIVIVAADDGLRVIFKLFGGGPTSFQSYVASMIPSCWVIDNSLRNAVRSAIFCT